MVSTRAASASEQLQRSFGDSEPSRSQTLPQGTQDSRGPDSGPLANAANTQLEEDPLLRLRQEQRELDRLIEEEELQHELRRKRARLEALRSGVPEATSIIENPPHTNLQHDDHAARERLPRPEALPTLEYRGKTYQELQAFLHDLEYRYTRNHLRNDKERLEYAAACLRGNPKQDWINYIAAQKHKGLDTNTIPLREFQEFLEDQLADPTTRAIAAAAAKARLYQGENESVMQFIRRYQEVELESPQHQPDEFRIAEILSRFKPYIRIAISSQTQLPHTWTDLVSVARRIEAANGARDLGASASYPQRPIRCYNCGAEGHRARECPSQQPQQVTTNNTNTQRRSPAPTAPAPDAPPPRDNRCFNCEQRGHYANACPEPPRRVCYTCNQPGHFSGTCPASICRICGGKGHTAARCRQPSQGTGLGKVATSSNSVPINQRQS